MRTQIGESKRDPKVVVDWHQRETVRLVALTLVFFSGDLAACGSSKTIVALPPSVPPPSPAMACPPVAPGVGTSADTSQGSTLWLKQTDGATPSSDANLTISATSQFPMGYAMENQNNTKPESDVFFRSLVHRGNNPWEAHVGTSGAIYSLRMPAAFGSRELICCQSFVGGEWTDRVIQFVGAIDDGSVPPGVAVYFQQAGTAIGEAAVNGNASAYPIYSPNLAAASFDHGFSVLTLPLLAAGPSHVGSLISSTDQHTFEWLLLQQHVRDLGDGIIEMTYVAHNFNPNNVHYTYINAPFSGFTRAPVPVFAESVSVTSQGYYGNLPYVWGVAADTTHIPGSVQDALQWHAGDGTMTSTVSSPGNFHTAGWVTMAATEDPAASAIGMVIGKDSSPWTNPQVWSQSWGWHADNGGQPLASSDPNTSMNIVNMAVFNRTPPTLIPPGAVWFSRYYLILGTTAQVASKAASLPVYSGIVPVRDQDAGYISAASSHNGYTTPGNVSWSALSVPVPFAKPLFLAIDSTQSCPQAVVTGNPRYFDQVSQTRTKLIAFLGYGIRVNDVPSAPTDLSSMVKLSTILGSVFVDPSLADPDFNSDVWVRSF